MSDGTVAIADTLEAITSAWVTSALLASGHLDGGAVVDLDLSPVGTGQMCDSLRVRPTYDRAGAGPETMVAKIPAADPTSRATAKTLGTYENEVRFYQQLADDLPIRTPAVFHADIDVESARFVLLLEDLAPGQQGDQLVGCTPEVAELAVTELVKLHAPRWGDPTLEALPWLHRDRTAYNQFMLMLMPNLWDGFRARYAADLGPEAHAAGEAVFARLEAYLTADRRPMTIVHGDYRLDNLLFDPTPGGVPIAVVDWQTCTHGAALDDVAYFVGAGLPADARREVEERLVRGYHDRLVAEGVAGYDWETCWHDYRRGSWAGLLMAVGASMLVEQTARGDQMFMAMAARHARHALDLDAQETLTG